MLKSNLRSTCLVTMKLNKFQEVSGCPMSKLVVTSLTATGLFKLESVRNQKAALTL